MCEVKMNNTCNVCDYTERLAQFRRGDNLVYGKERVNSYKKYDLIYPESSDDNGKPKWCHNIDKIEHIYSLFLYNLKVLSDAGIFKIRFIEPTNLVYATKGVFWDWTDKKEFDKMKLCVETYGLYFPIFVLPEGIPHNQIDDIDITGKYNAYNGNHRIDIVQTIYKDNRDKFIEVFNGDQLLCVEIPQFCEKSCTGFKYTPIRYDSNGPVDIPEYQQFDPINLFMLRHTNSDDEMKIDLAEYHRTNFDIPLCGGIDVVAVKDYQVAFRILQSFQNVLEYPLTSYYDKHNSMPEQIIPKFKVINSPKSWSDFSIDTYTNKIVCPCTTSDGVMCHALEVPRNMDCNLGICCQLCAEINTCNRTCYLSNAVDDYPKYKI